MREGEDDTDGVRLFSGPACISARSRDRCMGCGSAGSVSVCRVCGVKVCAVPVCSVQRAQYHLPLWNAGNAHSLPPPSVVVRAYKDRVGIEHRRRRRGWLLFHNMYNIPGSNCTAVVSTSTFRSTRLATYPDVNNLGGGCAFALPARALSLSARARSLPLSVTVAVVERRGREFATRRGRLRGRGCAAGGGQPRRQSGKNAGTAG